MPPEIVRGTGRLCPGVFDTGIASSARLDSDVFAVGNELVWTRAPHKDATKNSIATGITFIGSALPSSVEPPQPSGPRYCRTKFVGNRSPRRRMRRRGR